MATVFAYDPAQNSNQPLLAASQQAFLNSAQATSVSTAIAVDLSTFTEAAPGTIDVTSTTPFATYPLNTPQQAIPFDINPNQFPVILVTTSSGYALLGYTGTTATSFTGCVFLSGQNGTVAVGAAVANPQASFNVATGTADHVCGSVYSDQSGTLTILGSFDSYNWDIASTVAVTGGTINAGIDQNVIAPYMAFLYTNGATAQNTFRFHVRVYGSGRQGA